jgi:hypothetical protein
MAAATVILAAADPIAQARPQNPPPSMARFVLTVVVLSLWSGWI